MTKQSDKEASTKRKEEKKKRKRRKAFVEILTEILASKRTFLKTPEQIEEILQRKIAKKTKEFKIEEFSSEEINSLRQIVLAISKRDEKVFNELCDRLRNRLMSLGGFSRRFKKLSKEIVKILKLFPQLDETLRTAKEYSKTILDEVKMTERNLNNKRNRKREGE